MAGFGAQFGGLNSLASQNCFSRYNSKRFRFLINPKFAISRITFEQLYSSSQGLANASDREARMATVVSNDFELLQAIAVGDSAAFSQYYD